MSGSCQAKYPQYIYAGDRSMEAIELADQELLASRTKTKSARATNPMLMGMDPPHFVLWVLRSMKSADLEQALLILPLSHVERRLYYLVLLYKLGIARLRCVVERLFLRSRLSRNRYVKASTSRELFVQEVHCDEDTQRFTCTKCLITPKKCVQIPKRAVFF